VNEDESIVALMALLMGKTVVAPKDPKFLGI
jgi:hypothetical protein